jgi:hypothetical protein
MGRRIVDPPGRRGIQRIRGPAEARQIPPRFPARRYFNTRLIHAKKVQAQNLLEIRGRVAHLPKPRDDRAPPVAAVEDPVPRYLIVGPLPVHPGVRGDADVIDDHAQSDDLVERGPPECGEPAGLALAASQTLARAIQKHPPLV